MRLTFFSAVMAFCLPAATISSAQQQGLLGEFYNGTNFDTYVTSRIDNGINFDYRDRGPAPGVNSEYYSIRWTGKLFAPQSGKYTFYVFADDGIRMWVNGQGMINAWYDNDTGNYSNFLTLEGGKYYDIKIEYYNSIREGELQIKWTLPNEKPADAKPVNPQNLFMTAPPEPAPVVEKPKQKKSNPPVKAATKPKPAIAQPEEKKPATPEPTPEKLATTQKELELKPIYFVRSKDIILSSSEKVLDNWVTFLSQKKDATIIISGHTDDVGNAEKNQELSEKRAQLVADYLTNHGLDANRIQTKGYGSTKPYFKNAKTESDRAQNRRVEIRVKRD